MEEDHIQMCCNCHNKSVFQLDLGGLPCIFDVLKFYLNPKIICFMTCYDLFFRNILCTYLHWILPLCALLYLDTTPVCTTFKFHYSL